MCKPTLGTRVRVDCPYQDALGDGVGNIRDDAECIHLHHIWQCSSMLCSPWTKDGPSVSKLWLNIVSDTLLELRGHSDQHWPLYRWQEADFEKE